MKEKTFGIAGHSNRFVQQLEKLETSFFANLDALLKIEVAGKEEVIRELRSYLGFKKEE